jgi:hypothetical protein
LSESALGGFTYKLSKSSSKEKLMSTEYRPAQIILMEDLFDGRLSPHGVTEVIVAGKTSPTARCLTDGNNCLWVYGDRHVESITRYGGNAPGKILWAIAETFDTDIYSEYEPQYWGFGTQEEWDACLQKMAEEDDAKFYTDIIRFLSGEPNDLRPGTIGMIQAEIARELVAVDPGLVTPERRADLLASVHQAYIERNAITVHLTDGDLALARLAVTHEDGLPSA